MIGPRGVRCACCAVLVPAGQLTDGVCASCQVQIPFELTELAAGA